MLNMPTEIRARIEALYTSSRAAGDELQSDLCRQALAGNHTAWMLCVHVILDNQRASNDSLLSEASAAE